MKRPTGEQYQRAAMALYQDDEIEIDAGDYEREDDAARVSVNDEGGAWVKAWVYVTDEEAFEIGEKLA